MRYLFLVAGAGLFTFFLVYGVHAWLMNKNSSNKNKD